MTGDDIAFRRAVALVFGATPPQVMRSAFPSLGAGKGAQLERRWLRVFSSAGSR